jgi:predicted aspartyl protease
MSISASVLALLLSAEMPAPPVAEAIEPIAGAEVIKTRPDSERRMTVPVRIGNNGPYHFVIDTGSQSSVVSTDLAMRLAIPPARKARIIGVGGTELVDTAIVGEFGLGRRSMNDLEVALLEAHNIGADGIVGIDSLQQQRVLLDFEKNLMAVGSARSLGGNAGFEIVVTAKRRLGQLIMTNALIDGVHADVIIDTGADTSIANRALQRALSRRASYQQITLRSVTGQDIVADLGFPRKLSIGEVDITNLLVAYADTPVFAVLDLERRPALMLGMRELRLFKRIAIDFDKRKVYFDLPKSR